MNQFCVVRFPATLRTPGFYMRRASDFPDWRLEPPIVTVLVNAARLPVGLAAIGPRAVVNQRIADKPLT